MRAFNLIHTFIFIGFFCAGGCKIFYKPGIDSKETLRVLVAINQRVQQDSLIVPGAALQLISSQFSFTEGPAVDKGIAAGDVIMEAGGKAVESSADVSTAIETATKDAKASVLLLIAKAGKTGETRFIALKLKK